MMVELHVMDKILVLEIETGQLDSLLLLLLLQLLRAALLRLKVHHYDWSGIINQFNRN